MDANKMIRASHKKNMRWDAAPIHLQLQFCIHCNPLGHSPAGRCHVAGSQPKLYEQTDLLEPLLKRRPPPSEHEYSSIAVPLKMCLQTYNELQPPRQTARRSAQRRRSTRKIIWAKRSLRAASSALRLAVRARIFIDLRAAEDMIAVMQIFATSSVRRPPFGESLPHNNQRGAIRQGISRRLQRAASRRRGTNSRRTPSRGKSNCKCIAKMNVVAGTTISNHLLGARWRRVAQSNRDEPLMTMVPSFAVVAPILRERRGSEGGGCDLGARGGLQLKGGG